MTAQVVLAEGAPMHPFYLKYRVFSVPSSPFEKEKMSSRMCGRRKFPFGGSDIRYSVPDFLCPPKALIRYPR